MGYIKNLIVIAYKKTTKFNTSLNEKILPADNPYHETWYRMRDINKMIGVSVLNKYIDIDE